MDERRELRASDKDRQAAVERLRAAHDEGRLDLHEYDARLVRAYQSVTYGDLADLFADLPETGALVKPESVPPATPPAAAPPPARRGRGFADLPIALKILWTILGSAVLVNLTVWLLVAVSTGSYMHFWPVWFTVPVAALTGVTVGVQSIRRNRPPRSAVRPADNRPRKRP